MSMFINGISPPKSCYTCDWYNKVQCPVNDGKCYYKITRHPNCPLTELPTHGRLIDVDKLMEEVYPFVAFGSVDYAELKRIAKTMEAVIEADGEKNE